MSGPAIRVIYNPTAGRGRAASRISRLRRLLGAAGEFQPSHAPGHAEELALQAARAGVPIVAAAGGDGTVHEVANGVLQSGRKNVAMAVFPIGSANDYAHSLGLGSHWWQETRTGTATRLVDVGLVRTPGGRQRYFINGLGLGFNAAVTIESRRIRRLQGVLLYGVGLLRALYYHYTCPRMRITIDDTARHIPTLALTVAIGRREGNFVLAPAALVDDGLFDFVHAGCLRRWQLLQQIPAMITGNLPKHHPLIWRGRCRHVRVESEAPLPVHLDGELFSVPQDGLQELEVQMLPGALRVQVSLNY